MKDPSGGTTGRVEPYGRLGWMGARAEYSHGEGFSAPTVIVSPGVRRTFKAATNFFNPSGTTVSPRKLIALRPAPRRPRAISPPPRPSPAG